MEIDDIDGARPTKQTFYKQRDNIGVSDISGACPKRSYFRTTSYDILNYNDVTKTRWVSKRVTNPLDPSYVHCDEGEGDFTNKFKAGKVNQNYSTVAGSKPTCLPPAKKRTNEIYGLQTQDIIGA